MKTVSTLTLRVSETGDGLSVRVGPVGAVGEVGQDQEQQQALIGQRQRLALLLQPRFASCSTQGEDAPQATCRCGRAKPHKVNKSPREELQVPAGTFS